MATDREQPTPGQTARPHMNPADRNQHYANAVEGITSFGGYPPDMKEVATAQVEATLALTDAVISVAYILSHPEQQIPVPIPEPQAGDLEPQARGHA